MKNILIGISLVFLAFSCNKQGKPGDFKVGDADSSKKAYSAGYDIGKRIPQVIYNLKSLDIDIFVQGMKDAINEKPQLTEDELARTFQQYQNEVTSMRTKEMGDKGRENLAAGNKFLEENKANAGVIETASGLQYKIVRKGKSKGKYPKETDVVTVNYEGTIIDGTIFDSSYKRNQPATFGLNRVIPGWTEGLQLINEGGEIMLYIPSNLAYGPRGSGNIIGPNSVIIFRVELLKVDPAPEEVGH